MNITYCKDGHFDARGSITDIVQDGKFQHATIIRSKAGARRGDHYHLLTTQYVYVVSGELRILSRMPGRPVQQETLYAGALLANVPMEEHALIAVTDCVFLVLTDGPRGGDGYESDTYRIDKPLGIG